ncbi:DmsC/YnfH family molybdoenzyme membrane anchor subunit [Shigella sonnei]
MVHRCALLNSLNRVGASALSNEIASGSILFCCRRHRPGCWQC